MREEAIEIVKSIMKSEVSQGWNPTSGISVDDYRFYRDMSLRLLFPKSTITEDQVSRLRDIRNKIIE
jgi:hypothetical protein